MWPTPSLNVSAIRSQMPPQCVLGRLRLYFELSAGDQVTQDRFFYARSEQMGPQVELNIWEFSLIMLGSLTVDGGLNAIKLNIFPYISIKSQPRLNISTTIYISSILITCSSSLVQPIGYTTESQIYTHSIFFFYRGLTETELSDFSFS